MPYNEYNLQDIFAKQFGYRPQEYKIDPKDVKLKSEGGKYGSYYAQDVLGRTVYMPVTLGGLFLPYTWISVSSTKTIIETPMTEVRGTVKEIIKTDDYVFSLKGFIIGHDGKFPEKDVEDLRALYERNEALEIKCILTDIFLLTPEQDGQDNVVIRTFDLDENPGVEHVRAFEMNLVSDQAFELEII